MARPLPRVSDKHSQDTQKRIPDKHSQGVKTSTDSVFADTDGPNSVSVMEGDSVTINSGLIAIQSDDVIEWRFDGNRIAKIPSTDSSVISVWISPDEAFLNRLQLNNQTGDLKITNIKTTNSGQYTLQIRRSSGSLDMTFIVKAHCYESASRRELTRSLAHSLSSV
ncbi:T-lymphocyte surface antigen Ly-9 [Labeo rohita]|uniref:T-lymphocyte surface antigen Ly-9 n=1 Tax=Labeo rohita TaxID=84645 RepID=A0ABQ8L8V6_LABRO|nr:T-lymphocyte surface antigen Ly-9 [Labeo rohita]